jgi:hypothetical protein
MIADCLASGVFERKHAFGLDLGQAPVRGEENASKQATRGHMTHLSWDESGACVLGNGTILAGADGDMPPPDGVDGEYLK